MYETFDHTADIGLRMQAADLETLFAEAGRALFSLLVENPEDVTPRDEITIQIDGAENEYLLFDWLNELLYRFESEHWVFSDFDVQWGENGLVARVRGEIADPVRHQLAHEVKAITYHGLRVESVNGQWVAEVIVDI